MIFVSTFRILLERSPVAPKVPPCLFFSPDFTPFEEFQYELFFEKISRLGITPSKQPFLIFCHNSIFHQYITLCSIFLTKTKVLDTLTLFSKFLIFQYYFRKIQQIYVLRIFHSLLRFFCKFSIFTTVNHTFSYFMNLKKCGTFNLFSKFSKII